MTKINPYFNPYYPIVELTQEQYDALEVKDANTLYAIPYGGSPRPETPPGYISGASPPRITGTVGTYSYIAGTVETEES